MNLNDIAKALSVPVAYLQTGTRKPVLRVVRGGKAPAPKPKKS